MGAAERIARLLDVEHGGSGAHGRAMLSDGSVVLVTLHGGGSGPAGLPREFIASRVASPGGLPVPRAQVVALDASLPSDVGTDEFDDMLRRSPGLNLAFDRIADAGPMAPAEVPRLPRSLLPRVAPSDVPAALADLPADWLPRPAPELHASLVQGLQA